MTDNITVTQADREAAAILPARLGMIDLTGPRNQEELAEAFARHRISQQEAKAVEGDVVEAIQKIIDHYRIAGANLLCWLDEKDLEEMPRPSGRPAGLPWNMPTSTDWQNWASDVACRKFFEALEKAKQAALTKSQDKTAELLREVEKQIAHALETERQANKQVELRGDLAAAESAVAEVRRSHKLFFRWAADHFMSRIDDHLSQGESA